MGKGLGKSSLNYITHQDKQEMALQGKQNVSAACLKDKLEFKPCEVAYEQALLDTLVAGQEKEGRLETTALEFEFHLQFSCGSPSTEQSDFSQSMQSGTNINVNKH